jgi:hypothetical protein
MEICQLSFSPGSVIATGIPVFPFGLALSKIRWKSSGGPPGRGRLRTALPGQRPLIPPQRAQIVRRGPRSRGLVLRHFRKMNINLAQANGVCLTRWQMWALKQLARAKALVDIGALCGTTKVVPCYKANPCRRFSGKAGARACSHYPSRGLDLPFWREQGSSDP